MGTPGFSGFDTMTSMPVGVRGHNGLSMILVDRVEAAVRESEEGGEMRRLADQVLVRQYFEFVTHGGKARSEQIGKREGGQAIRSFLVRTENIDEAMRLFGEMMPGMQKAFAQRAREYMDMNFAREYFGFVASLDIKNQWVTFPGLGESGRALGFWVKKDTIPEAMNLYEQLDRKNRQLFLYEARQFVKEHKHS